MVGQLHLVGGQGLQVRVQNGVCLAKKLRLMRPDSGRQAQLPDGGVGPENNHDLDGLASLQPKAV